MIGGSALLALGLVERTTRDVDIVALRSDTGLDSADPLPGKHEADLRALEPTEAELIAAARWSRSQDPSEGYAQVLRGALESFGVTDVDL